MANSNYALEIFLATVYELVLGADVKKENEAWYLYKRVSSNQAPGLFLTGQISLKDIRKIRSILRESDR